MSFILLIIIIVMIFNNSSRNAEIRELKRRVRYLETFNDVKDRIRDEHDPVDIEIDPSWNETVSALKSKDRRRNIAGLLVLIVIVAVVYIVLGDHGDLIANFLEFFESFING